MVEILILLKEIFMKSKTGEKTDDETDDQKDDEQPNTKEMPGLESEEFSEQRRNQNGQGLKVLTSN